MPYTVTLPLAGNSSPLSSFAKVDLPQPLCPTSATKSPSSIERVTSFTPTTLPTVPSSLYAL